MSVDASMSKMYTNIKCNAMWCEKPIAEIVLQQQTWMWTIMYLTKMEKFLSTHSKWVVQYWKWLN